VSHKINLTTLSLRGWSSVCLPGNALHGAGTGHEWLGSGWHGGLSWLLCVKKRYFLVSHIKDKFFIQHAKKEVPKGAQLVGIGSQMKVGRSEEE
jgi:hypothetical protein